MFANTLPSYFYIVNIFVGERSTRVKNWKITILKEKHVKSTFFHFPQNCVTSVFLADRVWSKNWQNVFKKLIHMNQTTIIIFQMLSKQSWDIISIMDVYKHWKFANWCIDRFELSNKGKIYDSQLITCMVDSTSISIMAGHAIHVTCQF